MNSANTRILVYLLLIAPSAAAQTGGIAGSVTSAVDSSAVPNAAVTYRRLVAYLPNTGASAAQPQLAPGEVHFETSSQTDSQGIHSASGLPPGNYQVCVSVPDKPFLDPCQWFSPPLAVVTAGTVAPLDIQLTPGALLNVTVNDPQQLLPTSESGPLDFPHLIVGVYFGSGAFLAAQRTAAGTGTQIYSMAVPTGIPLNLWLHSRFVSLADAAGNPLASAGAKLPFTASPNSTPGFTVNVTGPASTSASQTSRP